MTLLKSLGGAAFALVALTGVSAMAAGNGKLMVIITPAHNNMEYRGPDPWSRRRV